LILLENVTAWQYAFTCIYYLSHFTFIVSHHFTCHIPIEHTHHQFIDRTSERLLQEKHQRATKLWTLLKHNLLIFQIQLEMIYKTKSSTIGNQSILFLFVHKFIQFLQTCFWYCGRFVKITINYHVFARDILIEGSC